MLVIDGSEGEGGGQILRTSLGLSLVTGRPIRIEGIRAKRAKPGLMAQHLAAVEAAAKIGDAEVSGAALGSREITFRPSRIRSGEFHFAVGTAGSATLVLQTVLPALIVASGRSILTFEGGTHNPWAPPFDFLQKSFLPLIERMGPRVEVRLERPGFYPAGGGRFTAVIEPSNPMTGIELRTRGRIVKRKARALVARLPLHIAERELAVIGERLGWPADEWAVEEIATSKGPGNVVILELVSENVTEVFTGFGRQGVRAESVAQQVCREVETYLESDVPVGEHLADQLLVPLTLAGGAMSTTAPSSHTRTNLDVIRRFFSGAGRMEQVAPGHWNIEITKAI
jgi:RNA 3'-terminal phosphate cyclase (ATP)